MIFSLSRSVNFYLTVVLFLSLFFIIAGQPMPAAATDAALADIQRIVRDSLEDLWTGREYGPELQKRQQALKSVMTTGLVAKDDLERMVEAIMVSLLDRQKTSRYSLKTLPDHIDTLLSPIMGGEDFEKIFWRTLAAPIDPQKPVLLTIGTLAPPGTPWLDVPETTAIPKIKKLTNGKIQIKIYGGGVLGGDTEVLDKMDTGRIDGCGCTALGILKASPELSTLLLPGLFNNYEEVDYIYEKFEKRLDKAFEEKGYILVALLDTGNFYLFSKNKINDLTDLKKQRVLSWFGAPEKALYEALGINAIHVSVPEVVSALSMGQADTNLAPAAWMLGMQAYQYMSFYYKPPLLYSPTAVFVSAGTPDRVRKQTGMSATFARNITEALVNEIRLLEPEWKKQTRSYEEKSLKAFEAKCGIKAIMFSTEDREFLKKVNNTVEQKIAGRVFPEDLINEVKKSLAEYRRQN